MKRSLVISAFLLGLLVSGCAATPAAAPVAPAAAAAPAAQDTAQQDRDRDRDREREREKERDRQATTISCPPGQHPYTDHGTTSCVRD